MKRVHVLDFDAGAETRLPFAAHGDIGVHAERSLFHVAIGGVEEEIRRSLAM